MIRYNEHIIQKRVTKSVKLERNHVNCWRIRVTECISLSEILLYLIQFSLLWVVSSNGTIFWAVGRTKNSDENFKNALQKVINNRNISNFHGKCSEFELSGCQKVQTTRIEKEKCFFATLSSRKNRYRYFFLKWQVEELLLAATAPVVSLPAPVKVALPWAERVLLGAQEAVLEGVTDGKDPI